MGRVISLATGKAIVVAAEGDRFSLRMTPALNAKERAVVAYFDQARPALANADALSRMFPSLYRAVIDRTGGAA